MGVDLLVFEAMPQSLDEDVVHAAAPAVHADGDLMLLQRAGERPLLNLCSSFGQDFRDFERHKLIAFGRYVLLVQSIVPRQVLSFQFG
jgi:hypothetical protein